MADLTPDELWGEPPKKEENPKIKVEVKAPKAAAVATLSPDELFADQPAHHEPDLPGEGKSGTNDDPQGMGNPLKNKNGSNVSSSYHPTGPLEGWISQTRADTKNAAPFAKGAIDMGLNTLDEFSKGTQQAIENPDAARASAVFGMGAGVVGPFEDAINISNANNLNPMLKKATAGANSLLGRKANQPVDLREALANRPKEFGAENPLFLHGGELAGGAMLPLGGIAGKAKGLVQGLKAGAGEGAAIGGGFGALSSLGQDALHGNPMNFGNAAASAGIGALVGGPLGGLAGALGGLAGALGGHFNAHAPAPPPPVVRDPHSTAQMLDLVTQGLDIGTAAQVVDGHATGVKLPEVKTNVKGQAAIATGQEAPLKGGERKLSPLSQKMAEARAKKLGEGNKPAPVLNSIAKMAEEARIKNQYSAPQMVDNAENVLDRFKTIQKQKAPEPVPSQAPPAKEPHPVVAKLGQKVIEGKAKMGGRAESPKTGPNPANHPGLRSNTAERASRMEAAAEAKAERSKATPGLNKTLAEKVQEATEAAKQKRTQERAEAAAAPPPKPEAPKSVPTVTEARADKSLHHVPGKQGGLDFSTKMAVKVKDKEGNTVVQRFYQKAGTPLHPSIVEALAEHGPQAQKTLKGGVEKSGERPKTWARFKGPWDPALMEGKDLGEYLGALEEWLPGLEEGAEKNGTPGSADKVIEVKKAIADVKEKLSEITDPVEKAIAEPLVKKMVKQNKPKRKGGRSQTGAISLGRPSKRQVQFADDADVNLIAGTRSIRSISETVGDAVKAVFKKIDLNDQGRSEAFDWAATKAGHQFDLDHLERNPKTQDLASVIRGYAGMLEQVAKEAPLQEGEAKGAQRLIPDSAESRKALSKLFDMDLKEVLKLEAFPGLTGPQLNHIQNVMSLQDDITTAIAAKHGEIVKEQKDFLAHAMESIEHHSEVLPSEDFVSNLGDKINAYLKEHPHDATESDIRRIITEPDEDILALLDGMHRANDPMGRDVSGARIPINKTTDPYFQRAKSGMFASFIVGSIKTHLLHAYDAAIYGQGYVGPVNFWKGLYNLATDAETRQFTGSFHSPGAFRRMWDESRGEFDEQLIGKIERFAAKHPKVAASVEGLKMLEGGKAEDIKLGVMRAALLEKIAKNMNIEGGGKALVKELNAESLSLKESADVYAQMTDGLFQSVGYQPFGFHNRSAIERNLGKMAGLLKPFTYTRQVQSRLAHKAYEEAITGAIQTTKGLTSGAIGPRQALYNSGQSLSKAVTIHTMLALTGGRATLPTVTALGIAAVFGNKVRDDIEKTLDNANKAGEWLAAQDFIPKDAKGLIRKQTHVRPDGIPYLIGALDGVTRIQKMVSGAGSALDSIAHRHGTADSLRKAAAGASVLTGKGGNVVGTGSLYSLFDKIHHIQEGATGEVTRALFEPDFFTGKYDGKYKFKSSAWNGAWDAFMPGESYAEAHAAEALTTKKRTEHPGGAINWLEHLAK